MRALPSQLSGAVSPSEPCQLLVDASQAMEVLRQTTEEMHLVDHRSKLALPAMLVDVAACVS
jgi:hypothetical protein